MIKPFVNHFDECVKLFFCFITVWSSHFTQTISSIPSGHSHLTQLILPFVSPVPSCLSCLAIPILPISSCPSCLIFDSDFVFGDNVLNNLLNIFKFYWIQVQIQTWTKPDHGQSITNSMCSVNSVTYWKLWVAEIKALDSNRLKTLVSYYHI